MGRILRRRPGEHPPRLTGAPKAVQSSPHAAVAQLVEHQLAMLVVVGSSPISRSTPPPSEEGARGGRI